MAGNKDHDKRNDWDELKSAAANKAVKTAVGAGHNLSTITFNAGRGILNGIKTVAGSFAKGFGLVTGKVAAVGAVAGLTPLASNLTLVLIMSIFGVTVVDTIKENQYLEDLKYYTVWEEEDPCAGFTMDSSDMVFPADDNAAVQINNVRQIWSFFHWYAQQNGSDLTWDEIDIRVAGMVGCYSSESGITTCSIEGSYGASAVNETLRMLSSGSSTGAIQVNGTPYAVLGGMNLSAYSTYSDPIAHTAGYNTAQYQFDVNESGTMGTSGNPIATVTGDGGYYCGLGLGQWTGFRAIGLLVYSDMVGAPWYDITCQLAYMAVGDEPHYTSGAFIPYVTGTASTHSNVSSEYACDANLSTPELACKCWAVTWEGSSADAGRIAAANYWYQVLKTWSQSQIDTSIINSVCQMIMRTTNKADISASMAIMGNCGNVMGIGNMSVADYASLVSYDGKISDIYPGSRLAHYDNGTPLYRYVLWNTGIALSETNPYSYQDCAFGTCAVLRWVGADDNIAPGADNARKYMLSHPEIWQCICRPGDYNWDQLQPGDVCSSSEHIFIYVGEEAWLRFHLGPDDHDAMGNSYCSITYDSGDLRFGGQTVEVPVPNNINVACSSSFEPNGSSTNSRSMAGQGLYPPGLEEDNYYVFRNISPQVDSIYANIVDLDRLIVNPNQDGNVSTSVIEDGSYGTGHNTQCTILPDYIWVDSTGAEVVITNRYHFAWQSVRSNMYGLDSRIGGCPDYAVTYAANYNIHPVEDTMASLE